jgi:hypothetical protein
VKIELDRMLEAGIIEPVEESEWISPMVVKDKKTEEIRICIDLNKLNDAYFHDPFPTPFTDEVLDNVGRQEVYSFIDVFLDTIRSRLPRNTSIRPCLQQNGDPTNIQ